jgi:hypothetical protein
MKWSLGVTLLFISLISTSALADSLYLVPNCCGDNFGYSTTFGGHPLHLSGGTDPFFLSSDLYQPGATVGGGGGLFLYAVTMWVNGMPQSFSFSSGSIGMTGFTLPTDGRAFFTAPVQIGFSAIAVNDETGETLNLGGGARGSISFYMSPDGFYYAAPFTQAPEPATLGLFGTGLLGILAAVRKRMKSRRQRRGPA